MTSITSIPTRSATPEQIQEMRSWRDFLDTQIGSVQTRLVFQYAFSFPVDEPFFRGTCPKAVSEACQRTFQKEAQTTFYNASWSPKNEGEDYTLFKQFPSRACSTQIFLQHFMEQFPGKKDFSLLDVGGYKGQFVQQCALRAKQLGYTVRGLALSASDLRRGVSTEAPDENYLVMDMHQLLDDPRTKDLRFDMITCALTMVYAPDNAAMLSLLYEMLRENGILVIDSSLYFFGISQQLEKWVRFLNDKGYKVATKFSKWQEDSGSFLTLFIQKTHPHLNLPMVYATPPIIGTRAIYDTHPLFLDAVSPEEHEKRLQEAIKVRDEISLQKDSYDIGNGDLIKLFNRQEKPSEDYEWGFAGHAKSFKTLLSIRKERKEKKS